MKGLIILRDFTVVCICVLLLFLQHFVCFDFFDSNLWYLYVLAVLLASCQYLLLIFLNRKAKRKWLNILCLILYIFFAFHKLIQVVSYSMFDGLYILCLALDVTGAIFAYSGICGKKNNDKSKKMKIVIISSVVVMAVVWGLLFYNNPVYAHRVLKAIEKEDITQIEKLMKSPLGNLNSKPTLWIFEVIGDTNEPTPLQAACKAGKPEIVEILLENGANANYIYSDKSRDQVSPLMNAVSSLSDERVQVVQLLLEYGAFEGYKSDSGNDVLSCAVYASFERPDTIEIIELLEKNGARIHNRYPGENTLLHKACECDSLSVIQYLIDQRDFDVNVVNTDGDTPLIYFLRFSSNRRKETLQYLLESGADLTIKNNEGKTAYDYALELHPELAELLKQGDKGTVCVNPNVAHNVAQGTVLCVLLPPRFPTIRTTQNPLLTIDPEK